MNIHSLQIINSWSVRAFQYETLEHGNIGKFLSPTYIHVSNVYSEQKSEKLVLLWNGNITGKRVYIYEILFKIVIPKLKYLTAGI